MCWQLLHFGCRRTRSRVKLVDEQTGEPVVFHQVQCLLEVFLRLSRKSTDYVCGNGYTRDPETERKSLLG